jgi:hypothetical protein
MSPERRPTGIFSHGCFRMKEAVSTERVSLQHRTTDESQVGLIDHRLSWESSSGRERRRVKAQT